MHDTEHTVGISPLEHTRATARMIKDSELKITGLTARAVRVPMARPLFTASGAIEHAALILIDVDTDQGFTGRSYLFAFTAHIQKSILALLEGMGSMIEGDPASPYEVERKLRANHLLLGVHNVVLFAISGIDMALWDACSQSVGLPLAQALGGRTKRVAAYNSNGLGIMPITELPAEAEQLLAEGFSAIKLRLGRDKAADDLAAVRAVKDAIGSDVTLMCDFNQGLTVSEAIHRCRMLDDEGGLLWIEEPVAAENYSGIAKIAQATHTAISIGENFMGIEQMKDALRHECCDYVMPDVQRISGVTGWMRAAALADAQGIEMSSHLFPEYSCHLLAVTPTHHWLEYVDWANPVLKEPLQIDSGFVQVPDRPGSGVEWDEQSVEKYLVNL